MTSEFIYQIGEDNKLRKPSKFVVINKIKTEEIQAKIKYLKKCLLKFRKITGHGRGITGVQVGIPDRISVIYLSNKFTVLINPKIINKSKKLYKYPEMCMSALPVIALVTRAAFVEVEYYDEKGETQSWKGRNKSIEDKMMNRVLQHEIDHMNGIISVDLVKKSSELFLESDPKFYETAKFEEIYKA